MPTSSASPREQSHLGHKFIEGTLDKPRLQFDLRSELAQLHEDESWNHPAGRSSKTLVKHQDMRIVLIAMKANTRMHEHTASARISVHTLSGHVRLHLPGQIVDLPAGNLLALDESVPHDVEATEESAFLLTLSWLSETKVAQPKAKKLKKAARRRLK
ncbi:MAG TPA: cupin domain-containing protein [Candidatus Acidoferrum sp.]|nr:cupin domain-containing protein [Candidatus Acidoferrum sp.]